MSAVGLGDATTEDPILENRDRRVALRRVCGTSTYRGARYHGTATRLSHRAVLLAGSEPLR